MRRSIADNFSERERDALVIATASDTEVVDLCHALGDDPDEVAELVRQFLSTSAAPTRSEVRLADSTVTPPPLSVTGLLPLHRILLVDDDADRLAERVREFRRHQFRLGFVVEASTSAADALTRLHSERFEAVLIELGPPMPETSWILEKLKEWSTPLAPILLNSEGMEFLELRRLNRNAIRALARGLGKQVPPPYRKGPARAVLPKGSQDDLFDASSRKKTGTS